MFSSGLVAITLALLPSVFASPMYKRSEITTDSKNEQHERNIPLLGDLLGNGATGNIETNCQKGLLNVNLLSSVKCGNVNINATPNGGTGTVYQPGGGQVFPPGGGDVFPPGGGGVLPPIDNLPPPSQTPSGPCVSCSITPGITPTDGGFQDPGYGVSHGVGFGSGSGSGNFGGLFGASGIGASLGATTQSSQFQASNQGPFTGGAFRA